MEFSSHVCLVGVNVPSIVSWRTKKSTNEIAILKKLGFGRFKKKGRLVLFSCLLVDTTTMCLVLQLQFVSSLPLSIHTK